MTEQPDPDVSIGMMRENSLHAALKQRLAAPGDTFEVERDGYVIDIVNGERLIEIQTGNFTALKPKLARLLPDHQVCVAYPITTERWVRRVSAEHATISRRKSPVKGRIEDLFAELLRLPHLATHPNFSLKALLIQEEVVWRDDGRGTWRRKGWSVADRILLDIVECRDFTGPADYLALLPASLPFPFTNADLIAATGVQTRLAQKMTYCLRKMGLLEVTGMSGRSHLYGRV